MELKEVIPYLSENLIYVVILLAAALSVTIYKHLKKAFLTKKCFEEDVLDDYFHGRLKRDEELKRAVVSHLGICEKCRDKMYALQQNDI